MSEPEEVSAASTRTLEIIVSAVFIALSLLVMWDSNRLGSGWSSSGPESGYFPFYIGLMMGIASAVNLVKAFRMGKEDSFVSKEEFKLVGAMFYPSLVFVLLMQWIGIYVSGSILIIFFMRWQGKFSWAKCVLVGVGTSVALFMMFEIWFKVPLLKGPLEEMFGF
jgi:putative tricarboxylic transport membrane protein